MTLKDASSLEENYDKPRQHIKKLRHYFANKGLSRQSYGFFSSHVWMWELDHKESWAPKNWCFWTVVLKKTLESLLDCKEIQPVNPEGNQFWIFTGRPDAEAETPKVGPPDGKNCLTVKDPDAGKDWRQEEKGTIEDEMVECHHQLLEFTQTHVHPVDDAIQPSHPLSSPSPPALNLSQHQGLFQWVTSSHQVARVLGFQLQHQASSFILPMNIQDWFPLGWTGWISLQSKGLSRVFSNTTGQKHKFFGAQLSL